MTRAQSAGWIARQRVTIVALTLIAVVAAVLGPPSPAQERPDRRIAITVDDLPYVAGSERLSAAARVADGMLAALRSRRAPAVGFVTSKRVLVDGQVDARLDLLRRWRDAGVELANHSFSHLSFQSMPPQLYRDDVLEGDLVPRLLLGEVGREPRWYRHPFNHTGPSRAEKEGFEAFMAARGYRIAPFTVEHADYVFNRLYVEAMGKGDSAAMTRLGRAYLAQLDTALAFAEKLSWENFGRGIPQILLIHANDINADYLDAMLQRLARRGYRFVTLDEAVSDRAYATRDEYVGPTGISWLHRWRVALGLEQRWREEPDPPGWVLRAYQQSTSAAK